MNEKEKILAEIEAKLTEFDTTIEKLNQSARRENTKFSSRDHAALEKVKANKTLAESRLNDLKAADEDAWGHLLSELKTYVSDIDNDLRNSLAYAM